MSRTETAGGRVEKHFETPKLYVMFKHSNIVKRLAVVSACGTAVFAAGIICYEGYGLLSSLRAIATSRLDIALQRVAELEAEAAERAVVLAHHETTLNEHVNKLADAERSIEQSTRDLGVANTSLELETRLRSTAEARVRSLEASLQDERESIKTRLEELKGQGAALDTMVAEARMESDKRRERAEEIKTLQRRVTLAESEALAAKQAMVTAKESVAGKHSKPSQNPKAPTSDRPRDLPGTSTAEAPLEGPAKELSVEVIVSPTASATNARRVGGIIIPKQNEVVKAPRPLAAFLLDAAKRRKVEGVTEADMATWPKWKDDFGTVATHIWKRREFKRCEKGGSVPPFEQARILAWYKAAQSLRRVPPGSDAWELDDDEADLAQKVAAGVKRSLNKARWDAARDKNKRQLTSKDPIDREVALTELVNHRAKSGKKTDFERLKKSSDEAIAKLASTSKARLTEVDAFGLDISDARKGWGDEDADKAPDQPRSWSPKDIGRRNPMAKTVGLLDGYESDGDLEDEMPLINLESMEPLKLFVMPSLSIRAPLDVSQEVFDEQVALVGKDKQPKVIECDIPQCDHMGNMFCRRPTNDFEAGASSKHPMP
jgi:hypothetical protein